MHRKTIVPCSLYLFIKLFFAYLYPSWTILVLFFRLLLLARPQQIYSAFTHCPDNRYRFLDPVVRGWSIHWPLNTALVSCTNVVLLVSKPTKVVSIHCRRQRRQCCSYEYFYLYSIALWTKIACEMSLVIFAGRSIQHVHRALTIWRLPPREEDHQEMFESPKQRDRKSVV